jgi:hypothetical protein
VIGTCHPRITTKKVELQVHGFASPVGTATVYDSRLRRAYSLLRPLVQTWEKHRRGLKGAALLSRDRGSHRLRSPRSGEDESPFVGLLQIEAA